MATNESAKLTRFVGNLNLVFNQYESIALPWDKAITSEATRKFVKLTRLYRLPKSQLRDGLKRAAYYNRLKARRLLRTILQRHGLVVVFLCTQASNETQLGRLDANDVLKHLQHWCSNVAQPQQLEDLEKHLSGSLSGTGIAGKNPNMSPYLPSPPLIDNAVGCADRIQDAATNEQRSSQAMNTASLEHKPPTILQIGPRYLSEFLDRENGGILKVVCERGQALCQPYVDIGGTQEHRVTFTYGLGSALVRFMSESHAELKSDGTFALMDSQIQSSADSAI